MDLQIALTSKNVMNFYYEYKDLIKNCPSNITIDLNNIDEVDSSGIAVLLELSQWAKFLKKTVNFKNISASLQNLCDLYKIDLAA